MSKSIFILRIPSVSTLLGIKHLGESAEKVDSVEIAMTEQEGLKAVNDIATDLNLVLSPSKRYAIRGTYKVLEVAEEQLPDDDAAPLP